MTRSRNKDVEEFQAEKVNPFQEQTTVELFEECKGDSSSGKSIAYGDKGQSWREWLWVPKTMLVSGEVKVRVLSNGFEITMPIWFAEKNGF